jgi:hypothetical protein
MEECLVHLCQQKFAREEVIDSFSARLIIRYEPSFLDAHKEERQVVGNSTRMTWMYCLRLTRAF